MSLELADGAIGVGARLGRYEILHPLAEGGMAKVWLARAHGVRGFKKLVVLKTIKAQFSDEAQFQEMFLDEARIASGIQHQNVAQIIDLGEHGDTLFLAMEWVDGESLSRMRKDAAAARRAWPLGVAMRVVADACAGLHAAHELRDEDGRPLGVVHRDISPHNIMVAANGGVKVIDFGIAKARNRASADTSEGVLKGKFAYMSPQQAAGAPVDRSADLWAAGVCLYELLAGRRPFEADGQSALLQRILRDEVTNPLPASLPSPVVEVVRRALAPDPARRFATALEMQRALEAAMLAIGEPATTVEVAAFAASVMSKRAAARERMVALALDAARARVEAAGELPSMSVARLPAGILEPGEPRDPTSRAEPTSPALDEPSHTNGPSVATAPARPPRRPAGGWVVLGVVVCVGVAVTALRHAGPPAQADEKGAALPSGAGSPNPVVAPSASLSVVATSGVASSAGPTTSSLPSASASAAKTRPAQPAPPPSKASAPAVLSAAPPKPVVAKPKNEADDDF